MIAVWLVVPPSRVARPVMRVGSRSAVSAVGKVGVPVTLGTPGGSPVDAGRR
jgi:hypothetical protein